jgi:hypothetical protein
MVTEQHPIMMGDIVFRVPAPEDPPARFAELLFRASVMISVALAVWFWPLNGPHVSPSFDCTKAHLATEKTICRDPQLAQIDADAAAYYQDSLAVVVAFGYRALAASLQRNEQRFLEARNRCGTGKWCIERAYANLDRELTDAVGQPHPEPLRAGSAHLTEYVGADVLGWLAHPRRHAVRMRTPPLTRSRVPDP